MGRCEDVRVDGQGNSTSRTACERNRESTGTTNRGTMQRHDYFSNLPQLVKIIISEYLDFDSLFACSRASANWREVVNLQLKQLCYWSGIPKCRYFEHDFLHQWTERDANCGDRNHTWQRAHFRERATENNWRRGEIVANCIDLKSLRLSEFPGMQNPTYGEWVLVNSYLKKIVVVDLMRPNRALAVLDPDIDTNIEQVVILRVPSQPAFAVVGCTNGLIMIWQLDGETFPRTQILTAHESDITSLATSTASSFEQRNSLIQWLFISGSRDGTVRLWNASSGECLRVFREHGEPVGAVGICKDVIVSAGISGSIYLRHVDGTGVRRLRPTDSLPVQIEFNRKYLLCLNAFSFHLFDLENAHNDLKVENLQYPQFMVDFKSGNVLYGDAHELHVYKIWTRENIRLADQHEPRCLMTSFTANDKLVFVATESNEVLIWDRMDGTYIGKIDTMEALGMSLSRMTLTDSSQRLLYMPVHRTIPWEEMYIISVGDNVCQHS